MSDLIKMQFELARKNLTKEIEGASEQIFDIQPEGFNNTIRWHVGHILLVAEKFLFGKEGQLPENYNSLFGNGTKPSDWADREVPAVSTLIQQINDQLTRIKEIPNERFAENLPEPILGRNTYGELAGLTAYHESFHYGQIHALKKILG